MDIARLVSGQLIATLLGVAAVSLDDPSAPGAAGATRGAARSARPAAARGFASQNAAQTLPRPQGEPNQFGFHRATNPTAAVDIVDSPKPETPTDPREALFGYPLSGQNLAQSAPRSTSEAAKDYRQEVYTAKRPLNRASVGGQNLTSNSFWLALARDPEDEILGATLEPVPDALRAQLGLPDAEGLLVGMVVPDGAAAQAGLKAQDILLRLGEPNRDVEGRKPLRKREDLHEGLKAAGSKELLLEVLRSGKHVELKVQSVTYVTLGPVGKESAEYFLGVSVNPLSDLLKSHLSVPEGRGLVVSEVVADSPAQKAGVKSHDILLQFGDKPLTTPESLVEAVRAAGDAPRKLEFLRAGKPSTVEVKPEKRVVRRGRPGQDFRLLALDPTGADVLAQPAARFRSLAGTLAIPATAPAGPVVPAVPGEPLGARIDAMGRDLKALQKVVEELREALKAERRPNR